MQSSDFSYENEILMSDSSVLPPSPISLPLDHFVKISSARLALHYRMHFPQYDRFLSGKWYCVGVVWLCQQAYMWWNLFLPLLGNKKVETWSNYSVHGGTFGEWLQLHEIVTAELHDWTLVALPGEGGRWKETHTFTLFMSVRCCPLKLKMRLARRLPMVLEFPELWHK